MLIKFGGWDKN